MVKNQYPNHKFELIDKNNLPNIFVDKDKFQQILTNLIENSAKYSPDNSTTTITAALEDNNVIIKFSNTGIGIDEKDYDKIFTKFARLDNPLTRKAQGSGLGLYITKNLVEKLGGQISVKSEPIENSQNLSKIPFKLLLPVKSIEEQARVKCNQ